MQITLTRRGLVAFIDDEDYPLVSGYKWYARKDSSLHRPRFYAQTNVQKTASSPRYTLFLHLLVMNAAPGEMIDQRSGDGLVCRKGNLRVSTDSQNQGNRDSYTGTSAYKGVSWNSAKQKWRAAIYHAGRTRLLGYYETQEDAARAYDREAVSVHGAFARLNLP